MYKPRITAFIGHVLSAFLAISAIKLDNMVLGLTHPWLFKMRKSSKRIKRTPVHRFSSTRQNARYARQLACGQLCFADGSHKSFRQPEA